MTTPTEIGAALRRQRNSTSHTPKSVASLLRVPESTVIAWEAGRVLPSLIQASYLASSYGITVDALIGRREPDSQADVSDGDAPSN